jgi:translation initiation factor IF-2
MAEEKMMRLSAVAKQIGMGTHTIVDHLHDKGFKVDSSPNTKLNYEQLSEIAKFYKKPELLLSEASSAAAPVVEKSVHGSKLEDEIGIRFFRGENTLQANTEPAVATEKPSPVAPISTPEPEQVVVHPTPEPAPVLATPLPVIEKEVPKIEVVPEPTPAVVPEPTPQPVAVAEPAPAPVDDVIRAEAKVEGLKIIGKIDLGPKPKPYQEQRQHYRPQQRPTEQYKPAPIAQKPANAPIAPPQDTTHKQAIKKQNPEPAPVPAPIELIEAKAEALKGLTVLGKIQLPVEQGRGGGGRDADKKKKRKRIDKPAPKPVEKDVKPAPSANSGGDARKNNDRRGGGGAAGRGPKKEEFTDRDVQDQIKATMAKLGGANNKPAFGAKERRDKRRARAEQQELRNQEEIDALKVLKVTEFISASDLASMMDVSVNEVISACMQLGMFVSINQRLDAEAISIISEEFGFDVQFVSAEEEVEASLAEEEDKEEDLLHRAPIVTIMGHVDHGKTSLLDYIRNTKVAAGEAGGITQHIGAYSVKTDNGKMITFLDTPGHEAFTAMRARGAKVTDVVIIVIAADDAVMPTTKEAINHALVAGVPIVFAYSKIDKPGANADKVREQLSAMNLLVEEWGGKYQTQEISSKSGLGINELLEKVLLEAELLELKANPNKRANGVVIEAQLDKGRGYLSTLLIQAGTLKLGDMMLAGAHYGRVKAMFDHRGNKLTKVGPAQPALVLGLNGAPQAGDKLNVLENEREAREVAGKREQILREQNMRVRKHITLEEIGRRKAIGTFKELNVIVKGDVDGSVEALSDSLLKLSTEEVQVRIIHKGVGQVSESDVLLASTSDAIIVAFQVRPSVNARRIADAEQIEIRTYSIIYQAIDEIRDAMEGLLAPTVEEVVTANIEVRDVFKISKVGTVAGCYVLDGNAKRNNKVRLLRDFVVVHEGEISALKRYKDDVAEVKFGYECGLSIKNFHNIEVGDIIECYELKEVKRSL